MRPDAMDNCDHLCPESLNPFSSTQPVACFCQVCEFEQELAELWGNSITLIIMMRLSVADWLKSKMTRLLRKTTFDAVVGRLRGPSATKQILYNVNLPHFGLLKGTYGNLAIILLSAFVSPSNALGKEHLGQKVYFSI